MPQGRQTQQPANKPEKKFGPYPGGISIAVWRNEIQTQTGTRTVRSISISPRRYRDNQGQWRDSPSFRPSDLPALLFGLQQALEYIFTNPLPGQQENDDGQGQQHPDHIPY